MSEFVASFFAVYGHLINVMLLNAIFALGMYIWLRTGLFSLANAGILAISAYTSALLTLRLHTPFALNVLAGVILATVVAVGLGMLVLRLQGIYLALATVSFNEVVRIAALNWEDVTRGALGLPGIPTSTQSWHLVLGLVVISAGVWMLWRSQPGRALDAIRQDETAAACNGINVVYYKELAFVLGSVVTAFGGALLAHLNHFISPADFGFGVTTDVLLFVVLGGIGSWLGPVLGAIVLTPLPTILSSLEHLRPVVNGAIMLMVILFLPQGLSRPLLRLGRLRRSAGSKAPARPTPVSEAPDAHA